MSPAPAPSPAGGIRRRDLGLAAAATAAAATLPAALAAAPAAAGHRWSTVRLGTVGAVRTGGLFDELLSSFTADSGYEVVVSTGTATDLFAQARAGELDILATHLGLVQLADFVGDGAGRWPQLVLSTVFVLIATPEDPAGTGSATDAVDAFARIAQTQSPFVVNDLGNPVFVTDTLWHAAGQPDRTGWYHDDGLRGPAAVQAAARLGGYTIWGLHPFLALDQQQPTGMQPVLFGDSLLQRGVASVVVRPGWDRRVNLYGALAPEQFLLTPQTQGRIRQFRHPRFDLPVFWPAAHHNAHQ